MAFVDKHHKILREVIEKSERRFAFLSAVEIAAVVFHAAAITDLPHHFKIVPRAGKKPLRLEQFILFFKRLHFVCHIRLDAL